MDELKHSGMYELVERDKVALNEMRGRDKERIDLVKKMKKMGYPIEEIKKLSGLRKSEIDRI